MQDRKRYYWLKLHRDFFKRHDIKIIEGMENGKDYLLFYLKLLVESIDHDGHLRFSETIPYNDSMLATITGVNVDVVRAAVKLFTELKMMEILDDGTIYMAQVEKMIGAETSWARKKREYRERIAIEGQTEDGEGTEVGQKRTMSDKSKSKSKSKSKKEERYAQHPSLDVPINQTRYENLCAEHTQSTVDWAIQARLDWEAANGKPAAKDYAAAAANWIERAKKFGDLPSDEVEDELRPYRVGDPL